jgi:cbb3-type cytochrome oxidase maturation protein
VIEHLTLGEFVVALSMGLAALCAFLWGAATGAFRGGESIKHQVLRAEGLTGEAPEAGHARPEA